MADLAAGAGTIILCWLLEVRKPVLFHSIYLDGQDVEDTCPLGTVSALVNDKRAFPMLKAPTQGMVLGREFLGSRTLAYFSVNRLCRFCSD